MQKLLYIILSLEIVYITVLSGIYIAISLI